MGYIEKNWSVCLFGLKIWRVTNRSRGYRKRMQCRCIRVRLLDCVCGTQLVWRSGRVNATLPIVLLSVSYRFIYHYIFPSSFPPTNEWQERGAARSGWYLRTWGVVMPWNQEHSWVWTCWRSMAGGRHGQRMEGGGTIACHHRNLFFTVYLCISVFCLDEGGC